MMTHSPQTRSWHSDKIESVHLERLAVVYIRQSTVQQVIEHQESARLQYGLVDRAIALGWTSERVLTIDEDLGKSGRSAEGRTGFQRLVSEVGMNHVGLILGVEMSRLARCSKDWHQLLEICALFGTLIAALDGIYDPSHYNDRLLLGLKGTMSEAELHILKQRMLEGKHLKAERGELGFSVPIGYMRRPSGEIQFDPDEQVQQVVKLIFRKFEELGTLNGVLCYLVKHQIQVGVRVLSGMNKGDLEWRRPNRPTLQNLLKNPSYAGAYAYGRRQIDPRKKNPNRPDCGRVVQPPEQWHVLIRDHHPAYISWEQYQHNLAQLKSNQARADEQGAPREGQALLSGLVVCGRCGCRMMLQYHANRHRYSCSRQAIDYGAERCQSLSGECLDSYITAQVLHALQPAALAVSLAVVEHIEQERSELDTLWQQRLERAKFEAERAGRHYRLIEPEHRLVARHLAQEWEQKLSEHQQLQEEYDRFCAQQSKHIDEHQRQAIGQLAHQIPLLWHAQTTTPAQRKEVVRQVIQSITVRVVGESEQVELRIAWSGGIQTQAQITRPVAQWRQLSYYPQLCQSLKQWAQEGLNTDEIIDRLHQAGFHPPKRCSTFNRNMVRVLMRRLGLGTAHKPHRRPTLDEHQWWLPDLAAVLDMPETTLYNWIQRKWVNAKQCPTPPKHWIIWADDAELKRLKQHRQRPPGELLRERWHGQTPSIALPPPLSDMET